MKEELKKLVSEWCKYAGRWREGAHTSWQNGYFTEYSIQSAAGTAYEKASEQLDAIISKYDT